jgi:glycosyltransferase involved in cell wall biosynthesis
LARVSVILTSFNHGKYIRDAIDSVLNQTLVDLELVIIDDASTDDTWRIISSYKDDRIKKVLCRCHGDVLLKLNDVIREESRAKYIAIHHSDDIWEPEKLEKQVNFLDQNTEVGAVFSNAHIIAEDGSPFSNTSHFYHDIFNKENRTRHEWLRFFFSNGNALCHPSAVIRRVCFLDCGFYDNLYFQITDLDMWIRICLKYEIQVLPEKLVRFRVRDNEANASGNRADARIRSFYEGYKVCENYRKITTADDLYKVFPEAEKYHRPDGVDVGFVLGFVILEVTASSISRLFALELLREAIADPIREKNIRAAYEFDVMAFGQLTSKYDVFSLERLSLLNSHLAEMEEKASLDARNLEATQAVLASKDLQIDQMQASLSWRVTRILRFLGRRWGSGA